MFHVTVIKNHVRCYQHPNKFKQKVPLFPFRMSKTSLKKSSRISFLVKFECFIEMNQNSWKKMIFKKLRIKHVFFKNSMLVARACVFFVLLISLRLVNSIISVFFLLLLFFIECVFLENKIICCLHVDKYNEMNRLNDNEQKDRIL